MASNGTMADLILSTRVSGLDGGDRPPILNQCHRGAEQPIDDKALMDLLIDVLLSSINARQFLPGVRSPAPRAGARVSHVQDAA